MIRSFAVQYFKDLPILALSASAMLDEREKALKLCFNDFVTKPFQSQELKEKMIRATSLK